MKKIAKIFIVMCVVCFTASTTFAQVSVGLSVRIAPPELPVYVQPPCPTDGYLWQPGYWAYDDADGYYWVPGIWVAPPDPGLLWTPPYWGFVGGYYGFHAGYWGPHVGFYGGINYGYGYGGHGFYGGRWSGNRFNYNTAVMHVNRTVIHNTYVDRSVRNTNRSRYSFNGRGGVNAKPRAQEQAAMRDRHVQPTSSQVSHQQAAQRNKGSFAKVNHGRPASAAVSRPGGTHNNAARTPNRPAANVRSNATRPGRPANTAARAPRQQQQRATQQRAQQQRAPQQRAPQQRAPQQRVQQQRAQQQPRMQQQRAPQQRVQQQRAQQQPRMQQQRAPQQRMQAQPRQGGGGGHGGGERGHH